MIRVLIVDDEPLIAQAHRSYVERVPEFVVHGVVHSGNAAVRAVTAANATDQPSTWSCSTSGCPTPAVSTWLPPWAVCGPVRTSSRLPRRAIWRWSEAPWLAGSSSIFSSRSLSQHSATSSSATSNIVQRFPLESLRSVNTTSTARCLRYERPTIEQRHRKALRLKHSDSSQRLSGILRDP